MFSATLVSLVLASSALGNLFVTQPLASTSWPAGQQQTITWIEDGIAPKLTDFGQSSISIYVGNANNVTFLQSVGPDLDVSKVNSVLFTPDPLIGPDDSDYFVKFESRGFKDPSNPAIFAFAISNKFTLTGMTGSFNSSEQAEIDGQSTAPLPTPVGTYSASSTSSSSKSSTTTAFSAAPVTTDTASPASSSIDLNPSPTSGAGKAAIGGAAVVGAAVAFFAGAF